MGNVYNLGRKSKEEVKRIQELRRSNSATKHDSRENRNRTRGDKKRRAIRESR